MRFIYCKALDDRVFRMATRWIERTLPTAAEPGRRGFQDWLAGTKEVSSVIIAAFAFALSGMLKKIADPKKIDVAEILNSRAYNLWNKLLTHQDFEPLPVFVEAACKSQVARDSAPSIMGEIGGATIQNAGAMPVLTFKSGIVFWQSVSSAGRDHKRKELCGRARALRFHTDGRNFTLRKSAKKLFLVLDGEWRDEDLKVLHESGWDEFFYPDEMEKLAMAIA